MSVEPVHSTALERAHAAYENATVRGAIEPALWPDQRTAYAAGHLTRTHEIEGLQIRIDAGVTDTDLLAQACLHDRFKRGWTFPGPGSTYDTAFRDGMECAIKILLWQTPERP